MPGAGEEIRNIRIQKLEVLKKAGVDSYPENASFVIVSIASVVSRFSAAARTRRAVGIGGRVIARREHGKSAFFDIFDGSGKLQIFLAVNTMGAKAYQQCLENVDVGDFIAFWGKPFYTKRKEPTIEAAKWQMLTKSLRPLPEKWHGLSDVEERFRKRYLDILMNPEVRERFLLRSRLVSAIRSFFDQEGFLEVETPMLHSIAGGALARPFQTHHNALNQNFYLRIAPELYLKELLVGGIPKVYELGKNFRNEGIDHTHNPEFTTVEWYAAYWDRETMMQCIEQCFYALLKTFHLKKITHQEHIVVFPKSFVRLTFKEVLRRHALIVDYDRETRDSLVLHARRFGIEPKIHESKGKIADEIFKKVCRPKLIQPTFVMDHPLDISPLAKKNIEHPQTVLRFQLFIAGFELANGFAELNDPLDQRERFMEQEAMRKEGEFESHPIDESFVEALEYGMPPAAGAAIGIDRLVMLLTSTDNIKEVILFPTLRSK